MVDLESPGVEMTKQGSDRPNILEDERDISEDDDKVLSDGSRSLRSETSKPDRGDAEKVIDEEMEMA